MKVMIEDEEWTLTPLDYTKKIIKSPNGVKYIKLDAYLVKQMEN